MKEQHENSNMNNLKVLRQILAEKRERENTSKAAADIGMPRDAILKILKSDSSDNKIS